MRSSWMWWALNPRTTTLQRNREGKTERHREETAYRDGVTFGAVGAQAKEHQESPATTRDK